MCVGTGMPRLDLDIPSCTIPITGITLYREPNG
jgi:hypothetical protein